MNKEIIWRAQNASLRDIEMYLVSLIKAAEETLQRVKTGGLIHNYSQNHDCYEYAAKVWKCSLRLAELKKLEYDVTGRDTWGMPKKDIDGQ